MPIDPKRVVPFNSSAPQPQPWPGAPTSIFSGTNLPAIKTGADTASTQQTTAEKAQEFPSELQIKKNQAAITALQLNKAKLETGAALGDPKVTGPDRMASVPPEYQGFIKLLLQNKLPQITGYAFSKGEMMAMMNTAQAIDPTFDPSLMKPRAQAITDFTGMGKGAQAIGAINRVAESIQALKNVSDRMQNPNVGFSPLNKLIAGTQQNFSPVDQKHYITLVPEIVNQVDRIMKTVGQPTVAGNAEIMKGLQPQASTQERNAAFTGLAEMLHSAAAPLAQQWDAAYGGNKAPPMWISKNASDFLNSLAPNKNFGGDEWRGLPGLKGDGSPDQATGPGGHPPTLNPAIDAAFKFPSNEQPKAFDNTQKPFEVPASYDQAHKEFIQNNPPGSLSDQDLATKYLGFRQGLDKQYSELGLSPMQTIDPDTGKPLDMAGALKFAHSYNQGGLNPSTQVPRGTVPTNLIEQGLTSAPAVGTANAANSLLAGIPDAVNSEQGREGMQLANQAHPLAAFIGDVAGSAAPIGGTEAALAKIADMADLSKILGGEKRAKGATNVIANALYGGARGENEGTGAGTGALEGTAGALVGNAVTKGLTPLVSDATTRDLAAMGDGFKPTILQELGGGPGEQALKSIPFAHGNMADAQASWNIANANKILSNLPKDFTDQTGGLVQRSLPDTVNAGKESTDYLQSQLSNGYNFLKPHINGVIDPASDSNLQALTSLAPSKSDASRLSRALEPLTSNNGTFDGQDYVDTRTNLRNLREDYATQAENGTNLDAKQMMGIIDQVNGTVKDTVNNNLQANGKGALVPALNGLENGWRQFNVIKAASDKAIPTTDGVYGAADLLRQIGRSDAMDMQPDARAAARVMGSQTVNNSLGFWPSVTAAGAVIAPAFAGAAAHHLTGSSFGGDALAEALGGGAAALYAPMGINKLTRAALLARPDIAARTADNPILGPLFNNVQPTTNAIADAIRQRLADAQAQQQLATGQQ